MSPTLKAWYNGHPFCFLLFPLTVVFWLLSATRRFLYKVGVFTRVKVKAKVVVVGNISVGGNGKTPVVLALAEHFHSRGLNVGILSRGYGGKAAHYPCEVTEQSLASEVGDEPRLLAARSGATVVVDPNRGRGAQYLSEDKGCDIIICDDGLQHYRLHRDVEVVVMDDRKLGSGLLLPMGPLREGKWRLATVDAIVHNVDGEVETMTLSTPQYPMTLHPSDFVKVNDASVTTTSSTFAKTKTVAIAGIGNPERFFNTLRTLGLSPYKTIPFADHHHFEASDLPNECVLMTQKDAVKVASFAHDDCWYLPVTAKLPDQLYAQIANKLNF